MKLCLYSITYSGTWFEGGLSWKEFMDRAKEYGFDGVEIDLKGPMAFVLDMTAQRCQEMREYANSLGLEIAACAGNNNFSSPVVENIENELLMLREQIRITRDLGAPYLRVFAAWRGVTMRGGIATYDIAARFAESTYMDATKDEIYDRVSECLRKGAEWAKEAGVILVLQNHPPVTDTYTIMMDMVRQIGSSNLKCCLDAPNCGPDNQSDEYLIKAVREVGDLQCHTHASGEFEVDENGEPFQIRWGTDKLRVTNYPAFISALKEIGYDGYISYEFCHRPRKNGKLLGIEYIDDQVKHAVRYFRKLMA